MPDESVMWGIARAASSARSVAVEMGMMMVMVMMIEDEKRTIHEMESR